MSSQQVLTNPPPLQQNESALSDPSVKYEYLKYIYLLSSTYKGITLFVICFRRIFSVSNPIISTLPHFPFDQQVKPTLYLEFGIITASYLFSQIITFVLSK